MTINHKRAIEGEGAETLAVSTPSTRCKAKPLYITQYSTKPTEREQLEEIVKILTFTHKKNYVRDIEFAKKVAMLVFENNQSTAFNVFDAIDILSVGYVLGVRGERAKRAGK